MPKKPNIVVLYPPGDLRQMTTGRFRENGYRVDCPDANSTSVEAIRNLHPDCLFISSLVDNTRLTDIIKGIRESVDLTSLPIIVAIEDYDGEFSVDALKAGASLCIPSDIVDVELMAHLDGQLRMWGLQMELSKQLEINDSLLKRLQDDLSLGQKVQQSFLPQASLRTNNFNLQACLIPSEDLSGDYFDYRLITPDRLVIFLADVSGHGVASALLAGRLKAFFDENFRRAHRPKLFLEQLNKVLNDLGDHDHIATAVCVHIDVVNTTMVYANAGHRSLYWLDSGHNTHSLLQTTGPGIGMFDEFDIEEITYGILPGRNRLVSFTDGLIEFKRPDGEWATEEDFRDQLILPNAALPLDHYFDCLLDGSSDMAGEKGWDDDVSLLVADF